MESLRNLSRRKMRSTLTISGIVIGIFALTTMGAMAARFSQELDGGVAYFGSTIQVGVPDGQLAALLPATKLADIASVSGVDAVYPSYSFPLTAGSGFSFGEVPESVVNRIPAEVSRMQPPTPVREGRDITEAARGDVVIGSTLARKYGWTVGQSIDLPRRPANASSAFVNHPFTVIGILQPTSTAPDDYAYVSTNDAQTLLVDSVPAEVRASIDPARFVPAFTAFGAAGTSTAQLDGIADSINAHVPGVKATEPSTPVNNFKSFVSIFTAITTGIGVLALVIGGLSVVNTMAMAVTERVREIGRKRALGARTRNILGEFLAEASVIGLLGGGVGYLLAFGLTSLLNASPTSAQIFAVTPLLTILVIGFAVLLACLAGVLPAIRASRIDPVTALRTTN